MGTLFERMSRLAASADRTYPAGPIDTSTLGPIKHDPMAGVIWHNPRECAVDLRIIADQADSDGLARISPAKLRALARLMDQWPDHSMNHIASGWMA